MTMAYIDIFSDPVCPWCFIGLRRIRAALVLAGAEGTELRWQVFQLNPAMPREGMERAAYLAAKFGGVPRAGAVYATIRAEGEREGIAFAFDRIRRTPNTIDAHRLIRLAAREGKADQAVERLFEAYFLEGRDIGDGSVLSAIGRDCGIEGDVAAYLEGGEDVAEVRRLDATARSMGISGVPYFVFNGRYSVSGAEQPEVLARAVELARETAEDGSRRPGPDMTTAP